MTELAWAEHAARMFEPAPPPRWATPGELARHVDPATKQTPALDLIDTALVEAFNTPDARLIIAMPPQEGKALALDTPIATPTGWTTMGQLVVGDEVFDRHGRPCRVTWLSPIWQDRPCFTVRTGDGEAIVADAAHEWPARLDRRRSERTVETTDLARSRGKHAQITAPAGLDLPDADLPLDPYVLGAWLGDGDSRRAGMTCADPEIIDRIRAAGVPACKSDSAPYRWTFAPEGSSRRSPVRAALEALRVWGNKHIPDAYLRGSRAQRLALLQGLVDTDGHVSDRGQVEFVSTTPKLADGVRELVYSLGAKATLVTDRAMLRGVDCGPRYRVRFYLAGAAWLPRKAERCRDSSVARVRYVWAEAAESVPVRCIEVDSPDHTYLAGRSLLPTHNSQRASRWFPLWALLQNPELRVAVASYEHGVARRWGRTIRDDITSNAADLGLTIRPDLSAQAEWQLDRHRGGVYSVGVGGALTGRPVDLMIIDDPFKGHETADSLTIREAVWEWWTGTVATRFSPGAPVILIQTRWHEDDLAGRLINGETADRWKVISIPAQCEDPATDPLGRTVVGEFMISAQGRTQEQWEIRKSEQTTRSWAALYQQHPTPVEGAVWKSPWIETNRGKTGDFHPHVTRVIVGVDPAATSKNSSDETGIVVVGLDREGYGWVLDDRSGRGTPIEWASRVWNAVLDWGATEVVVEDNQGGEMVLEVMRTAWRTVARNASRLPPPVRRVHATKSKRARAESVAAFYETGRVRHAADGTDRLAILEQQMLTWTGTGDSPDRIDALVHALTALFLPQHSDGGVGTRPTARTRWAGMRGR